MLLLTFTFKKIKLEQYNYLQKIKNLSDFVFINKNGIIFIIIKHFKK